MNNHSMTEPALYSDQNLFRLIVEASPAGMLIADADGQIVLANRTVAEQFGYQIGELHGQSVEMLIPAAHHTAHVAHRARYMAHPEPRPMAAGRDLYGKRKDGSEFPVDISLHPIEVEKQRLVLANIVDVTDRRRAEQERERRQRMERLALLGQLAGGVAHEIRTPLCVIRNDAYFLKMIAGRLGPDGVECVDEINTAVGKAERIVSELLDFTRDPASQPQKALVRELIDRAARAATIPDSIELICNTDHSETSVQADPEQIERVLINLFRNAAQAIGRQGTIEVHTTTGPEHVTIEVRDDGAGIAPEDVHQVFEPLFTTKAKGIGLGLAVSKRYAERSGGTLIGQNNQGPGACFRLTLPRGSDDSASTGGTPPV